MTWRGITTPNQSDRELMLRWLLKRAGVSEETISKFGDERALHVAMELVADLRDVAPDEAWFRQWYQLTGEHMVLTEEGWVPAWTNTRKHCGCDPMEVFEEINRPDDVASVS